MMVIGFGFIWKQVICVTIRGALLEEWNTTRNLNYLRSFSNGQWRRGSPCPDNILMEKVPKRRIVKKTHTYMASVVNIPRKRVGETQKLGKQIEIRRILGSITAYQCHGAFNTHPALGVSAIFIYNRG